MVPSKLNNDALFLRLLVGFLGEQSQFNWWHTSFFSPANASFLEPTFPKTLNLARYHGVVEAARVVHDENLTGGSYHLFRLPEEIEQELHNEVHSNDLSVWNSKETAMTTLTRFANTQVAFTPGPVSVGKFSDIASKGLWKNVASLYHAALTSELAAFPYFSR